MSGTLPPGAKLFLAGRWISSAGNWLFATAIGWALVNDFGGGSEYFAASRLLNALGVALFASATGPLLERLSGVSVLVIACVVACIVSLLTAFVVWSAGQVVPGEINLEVIGWMLFASLLSGAALAYIDAGEQRIQALLVDRHQQELLESAWTKLYYLGRIVFGLLSGVVLAAFGCAPLFLMDAATFLVLGLVTVITVRLVPATAHASAPIERRRSMVATVFHGTIYSFRNYAKALRTVRARDDLRFIFAVLFVVEGIGFTAWNFLPAMIKQEFHEDGFAYGAVICLSGIGGLVGIISRGGILKRWPAAGRTLFVLGAFLAPLGLVGVSYSGNPWTMSVCYAVALLGWSWFLPPIRVFCRLGPEGPLIVAVLSLTLLSLCRAAQVVVTVILGTGFGLPGSVGVRCSSLIALLILGYLFTCKRKARDMALENMFVERNAPVQGSN